MSDDRITVRRDVRAQLRAAQDARERDLLPRYRLGFEAAFLGASAIAVLTAMAALVNQGRTEEQAALEVFLAGVESVLADEESAAGPGGPAPAPTRH